ncbi:neuropeptide B [Trichechus inunguis]
MAGPATLVAATLALVLLLALPGCAWYKPAAGPSYYTAGRAAGLLSGFRRSPYARRAESAVGVGPLGQAGALPELRPSLRRLAMCVRHVAPNLQSCEQLPDGVKTFQCKADVLLSLRAADCRLSPRLSPDIAWLPSSPQTRQARDGAPLPSASPSPPWLSLPSWGSTPSDPGAVGGASELVGL